jgi:hypothetical protein
MGILLAAGLTAGVLVSTLHAMPVPSPNIEGGDLLMVRCPSDVAALAPEGESRACRQLEIVNTGQGEGTAMCVLINDDRGADARYADNQSFHHTIALGAGQTGDLLITVDGPQAKHDAMEASCGIPPPTG